MHMITRVNVHSYRYIPLLVVFTIYTSSLHQHTAHSQQDRKAPNIQEQRMGREQQQQRSKVRRRWASTDCQGVEEGGRVYHCSTCTSHQHKFSLLRPNAFDRSFTVKYISMRTKSPCLRVTSAYLLSFHVTLEPLYIIDNIIHTYIHRCIHIQTYIYTFNLLTACSN